MNTVWNYLTGIEEDKAENAINDELSQSKECKMHMETGTNVNGNSSEEEKDGVEYPIQPTQNYSINETTSCNDRLGRRESTKVWGSKDRQVALSVTVKYFQCQLSF